ncbi:hypothetical protein J2J97_32410 (plasmid) [Rhizobium bangladeshense]|uniref:hypothetical protein n=1 Tax=Rhizobium bangladeshense TaxID=1138189 RepID=UPI001A98138E|nr:hypothetical protein [Rhizobium bangladeshense]QSY98609.1 hypothetical protein J2J97_32410 [Rhizobium bangladeshense]
MVSDRMYRRMCMSGWQAQQERRRMDHRNAVAALDRRTAMLLEIEHVLRGMGWMYPQSRFERHPAREAVILSGRLTPILKEFVRDGTIFVEEEFFPRQGINNTLIMLSKRVEIVAAGPPRALNL